MKTQTNTSIKTKKAGLILSTESVETVRWLDTVFQGQYLPSLSINYVAINKVLEKIATAVVLDKDENLL